GVSVRGLTNAALDVARLELVIVAVLYLLPTTDNPRLDLLWIAAGGMALAGVYARLWERGPWKSWAIWLLGWLLFNSLRAHATDTGMPVQFSYPIRFGLRLFQGNNPTIWLQEHLYHPGHPSALDLVAGATYLSFFFLPHLVAFVLWRRHPRRFNVFVLATLITLAVAIVFFYALPTAPPWLAAQTGALPHVDRILIQLSNIGEVSTYRRGYEAVALNDVAAMPSVHVAVTWLVVFAAWRMGRTLRWLAVAYGALMSFAVVYLGEHYVIDVIAGTWLAAAAWALADRVLAGRQDTAAARHVVVRHSPPAPPDRRPLWIAGALALFPAGFFAAVATLAIV